MEKQLGKEYAITLDLKINIEVQLFGKTINTTL